MRIVPEYEPVGRLYLSFVDEFFHTRFKYGKVICEIARHASAHVQVEIFVAAGDRAVLLAELAAAGVDPGRVRLNGDSPQRAILAEYMPIFAQADSGRGCGIVFDRPELDLADSLRAFSQRLVASLGLEVVDLGTPFATAALAVNEDIVLVSEAFLGEHRQASLDFFRQTCPHQLVGVVGPLAGDLTHDLDMYLWPVRPGVWIVSQYAPGSAQAISVAPAVAFLQDHGHEIRWVPGLPRIAHDDVDTMPTYVNGILVNGLALVPAYARAEDAVVRTLLADLGYETQAVDCRTIIESNSALHCISKTVPRCVLSDLPPNLSETRSPDP